ncbi:hypothetical protein N9P55_00060 [bacterium]|nr:hypothetical protein [bacterium]
MIKKYSILIFTLLLIVSNGISQEDEIIPLEIKKWTIKSIVFSQPYSFETDNSLPLFFTGIGAKRNFDKMSYRISFEHINYIKEIESSFQKGFFKENTGRIGAGYKLSNNDLINLNIFLDATLSQLKQEANTNNLDSNINLFESYEGFGIGAIIGIGFDYFITPSFSLSLETRLDLMHITGDYHKEDFFNRYSVNYFTSSNKLNLNLLGNFSVNYHF